MRLLTLIALVAVAACNDITAPLIDSAPAPISAASPIALSTTLSSAVLAPGNSVTITVTLTNVADTAVTMQLGTCSSPFVVSTRLGRAVGPDSRELACPGVLRIVTLAPNESASFPQTWDGFVLSADNPPKRVSSGDYVVRGSNAYGAVRSNPAVALRILP
jgi:hypothetical protein